MKIKDVSNADLNNFNNAEILFPNADKKIINFMVEMMDKCEDEGKLINWADFKAYCVSPYVPLQLLVPESVIDRCIAAARELTRYKLGSKEYSEKNLMEAKEAIEKERVDKETV